MASREEISSTEKLLDLIRKEPSFDPEIPAKKGVSNECRVQPKGIAKIIPRQKTIRIGVDVGNTGIKLVKIVYLSDHKHQLLDYLVVPFEPGLDQNSPNLPLFLKTALSRFITTPKQTEIWSAISSTNVDLKFLRIPKVSKKQIPNAVFWTFKKETAFDEKQSVFDFQILGEVSIDGSPRLEVIAYAAPKQEIDERRLLFQKSGFPLTGITIVPFALQNLLNEGIIPTDENNVCTLFIGKDWSRIAIFTEGKLTLSRGIKAGMMSMIESLRENLEENNLTDELPAVNENVPGAVPPFQPVPETAFTEAKQIFEQQMMGISPTGSLPARSSMGKSEIFEMIQPALERLIRQVERTLAHYRLHFSGNQIQQIFISGQLAANKQIRNHISRQLGYALQTINPFSPWEVGGSLLPKPEADGLRESFVPAVGIALSCVEKTPNFLFTFREKEEKSRFKRFNRIIFTATGALLIMCVAFFLWQDRLYDHKKSELTRLQTEMQQLTPMVDQNLIVGMVAQTKNRRQVLTTIAQRYKGLAVIGEIHSITPKGIYLQSVTIQLEKKKNDENVPTNIVILDGIIQGEHLSFDTDLAKYLVRLKQSPLFQNPRVKKRSREFRMDEEVLHFTAQFDLVS